MTAPRLSRLGSSAASTTSLPSAPIPPPRPPRAPSCATSAPPQPSATSPSACASSSTSTTTSPNAAPAPPSACILLVASLNRCLAPRSKAGGAARFDRILLPVQARQLYSQRFRDNFDHLSAKAIQAIECDLVTALVRDFEIDLRQMLFDATNCFTFLDTFNTDFHGG